MNTLSYRYIILLMVTASDIELKNHGLTASCGKVLDKESTKGVGEGQVKDKKKRLKPDVRKAQIIQVTKELILENGLAWASSLRIAKSLGISQAALYHHFSNRREILVETLSSIMNEMIQKTLSASLDGNWGDYIINAATMFYEMTLGEPRLSRLLFEFFCAPPKENMIDESRVIFSDWLNMIENLVRGGVEHGDFRDDIDINVVAWMIASLGLGLQIGVKLEMPQFLTKEQALSAVKVTLMAIKNPKS